jgi:hypothetical protein
MVIFNGLGLLGKVNPCLCQRYYTISGLNYIIHRFMLRMKFQQPNNFNQDVTGQSDKILLRCGVDKSFRKFPF